MADTVFYNKRKLCYTEESDFTDFQGIGSDPLYLRYESVYSIVKHYINENLRGFLAQPDYRDGVINWYIEEWTDQPVSFDRLPDSEKARYAPIKDRTIMHYRQVCSNLPTDEMAILASALRFIDDRFIYCYDGKVALVAWGMRPDTTKHAVDGRWIKGLEFTQKHNVIFDAGEGGSLVEPERKLSLRSHGFRLSKKDIPEVVANEGFSFTGWSPDPMGFEVNAPVTFTATYDKAPAVVEQVVEPVEPDEPPMGRCTFLAGKGGSIAGNNVILKPVGAAIVPGEVPLPKADKGYTFTGWNIQPLNFIINGDHTFVAQFEKKRPWWAAVPRWLRWLLLFLLLLLLACLLFRGCDNFGCSGGMGDGDISTIDKIGDRDDNGKVRDITDSDGRLPDRPVTAPITDDDGEAPPVHHNEGRPDVIANRLIVFFEDDDADLNQWAQDFKSEYPGNEYQIIGYDPNVLMIVIMIPEDERDRIREELPGRLSRHNFFVLDESIMTGMGSPSRSGSSAERGWHLDATNVRDAWDITEGSPEVVVAIVDDGIDYKHPIFDNRFYKAYNVFTQDRRLSAGEGHGTHVAALAAGNTEYLAEGAAGVAPKVKIMPIQVFDNGICTFSSLAAGIMYAIHNGADVVNISIGPNFQGLDQMPVDQQLELVRREFKNEEKVFKRIIEVANKKNVILVFAAGNNNIITAILPECRSDNTINVAAVDKNLHATDFTNYAIGSNISAPGKDIYSAFPVNDFEIEDGTSMAAPIVTGAVALMRSIKPDLTVGQAIGVLQKTGKATDNDNRFVPPMIQIDKALKAVKDGDIPDGPIYKSGQSISGPITADPPVRTDGPSNTDDINNPPPTGPTGPTGPTRPTQPTPPGNNGKSYTVIDNETGETRIIDSESDIINLFDEIFQKFR